MGCAFKGQMQSEKAYCCATWIHLKLSDFAHPPARPHLGVGPQNSGSGFRHALAKHFCNINRGSESMQWNKKQ